MGGWETAKTQKTKLTPMIAKASIKEFSEFVKKFNVYLKKNGLQPFGKLQPVGSTSYYKQDLKHNVDKIYGDIDMLVEIPISVIDQKDFRKKENTIRRKYLETFLTYVKTKAPKNVEITDTLHTKGNSVIFNLGEEVYSQVDLILTFKPYTDWMSGRYKPQYGLKGFTIGNLYSALGVTLTLSFGTEGVLGRFKNGILVTSNNRKGIEFKLISTDIGKFIYQATRFLVKLNDPKINIKEMKIDPLLNKYKGIDTESVSIKSFCFGIIGMAKTLEQNGVLGKGGLSNLKNHKSFIKSVRSNYAMKTRKQLSKSKFKKAETPEAFEMIKQTRKHALEAVKIVNKYLK
jgi:hypothetical protein